MEKEKYSNADKDKLSKLVEKYKKMWNEEDEENKKKPKHYDSKRKKFVHKSVSWGFYTFCLLLQLCFVFIMGMGKSTWL